jgi:hypothetical protein
MVITVDGHSTEDAPVPAAFTQDGSRRDPFLEWQVTNGCRAPQEKQNQEFALLPIDRFCRD